MLLKLPVILFICSLFSLKGFSQADNTSAAVRWTTLEIQSLENQHIDTILCYHNECAGCIHILSKSPCAAYDNERYLFWYKNGRNYACSINKCGVHKFTPINDSTWVRIIKDYILIIKSDPSDTFKGGEDSGTSQMTIFQSGDDIPEDVFELYSNGEHTLLVIDNYYLQSAMVKTENFNELLKDEIGEIKHLMLDVMAANYSPKK